MKCGDEMKGAMKWQSLQLFAIKSGVFKVSGNSAVGHFKAFETIPKQEVKQVAMSSELQRFC